MIITLGFTMASDDQTYISYRDGYRIGAPQLSVTIALEGDGWRWDVQRWAEAVFAASNLSGQAADVAVAAIRQALTEQVPSGLRSLAVGDTVTVHGQMWACDPTGWHRVGVRRAGDVDD